MAVLSGQCDILVRKWLMVDCLIVHCNIPSQQVFLWPNGEGTGLRNQGLWVRVPPGAVFFFNLTTYIYAEFITILKQYSLSFSTEVLL